MKEHLLSNFLDPTFEKMLFPLNLMQSILLQPKYQIAHGFLTPNGFTWRAAGRLRAGGVVAVDAGLPLRLLALLTTYTVVLLQFAFL
ncbi:uncharacterized protein [Choristoneura fumiferana]|uniref:uncharacterized protein n=1 Tax=Choristoneura fumiferana TaxID=7141 RepID=UPI003D15D72C